MTIAGTQFVSLIHFAWVFFCCCCMFCDTALLRLHRSGMFRHLFHCSRERRLPVVRPRSPIASSVLDMILALIFSQLPHPECWMPHSQLEALNCFWLALPAWVFRLVLVLVWWWWWSLSPAADVIYVLCIIVSLASHSRGSGAPWSVCDTVVIWLFVQDYHSTSCAVLFSSPPGSNLTDIFSTQNLFFTQMWRVQNREGRVFSVPFFPPFFFFTLALSICYVAVFSFSHSLLFPNPTSIGFSGVDSRESAVERGSGKKKKKPLFDNVCLSLG